MRKLTFRVHAILKMFERGISRDDVHHVIETGEVNRTYPDDTPYASQLVLGWRDERPLHVAAADNEIEDETIIITAYEPDAALWEPDFRKKKD